jgi:hypothetical protein
VRVTSDGTRLLLCRVGSTGADEACVVEESSPVELTP